MRFKAGFLALAISLAAGPAEAGHCNATLEKSDAEIGKLEKQADAALDRDDDDTYREIMARVVAMRKKELKTFGKSCYHNNKLAWGAARAIPDLVEYQRNMDCD